MNARCSICGKEEKITKLHKDYKKIEANPTAVYICETCSFKLNRQAAKNNEITRKN